MYSLSITSCKRPELFKRTIQSLRDKCCELSFFDEVVWADDHSSDEDFEEMEKSIRSTFKDFQFSYKVFRNTTNEKGLDKSLNFIMVTVSNQYCLHIEDDWEFRNPNKDLFITKSAILLDNLAKASQILLKDRPMFNKSNEFYSGIPYYTWQKGEANDGQIVKYPGFTLNPSVLSWKRINARYGFFNSQNIEATFSERLYEDGMRTLTLCDNYINHIGLDVTSFALNQTPR